MRYLKLIVAYDGTEYCGWQVQTGQISVQQRLEESWQKVTGESIRIVASGRTDGGVHAEGQVCSLATGCPMSNKTLLRALNAESPFDISILSIEEAPDGFHAIRDAVSKTYRYQIQFGRLRDPLKRRYWWHVPRDLDLTAMQQGAGFLIGRHDFASFQSAGAERLSTVRTISRLDLVASPSTNLVKSDLANTSCLLESSNLSALAEGVVDQQQIHDPNEGEMDFSHRLPSLRIYISADGFLYKMVRNIVGSLVRVGEGRESPEWIDWVLRQQDRRSAGQAAPAHGLFLQRVDYRSSQQ